VISAWAGIRPLVAKSNKGDPASASREHSIQLSKRGVLTVTGGKLTTYRAMAEQIVDAAVKRLGAKPRACDTVTEPLPGARPAAHVDDVRFVAALPWRPRDIDHAIEQEFAESLADVMIRRTTLAFELRDQGRALAPAIAARIGRTRGWSSAETERALIEYEREVQRIFGINP
jgi:glycerol-3-phosphate dehydrogenase